MGSINDFNKKQQDNKILGNGKKPQKSYFKKKKINCPKNRKIAVERAKGKCLDCGSTSGVASHHIMFKSEVGIDDSFENLIPLCFNCHRKAHDGYYINKVFVTAKEYIIYLLERLDLKLYRDKIEERKRA